MANEPSGRHTDGATEMGCFRLREPNLKRTKQPKYRMKCGPCGYSLHSRHFNAVRNAMLMHYLDDHVLCGEEELRLEVNKGIKEQRGETS